MSLEFRIEKMNAYRVVGVVVHTTTENDSCVKEVPLLWGEVIQQGRIDEIVALSNQSPFGLIGINSYNTDPVNPKSSIITLPVPQTSLYQRVWLSIWCPRLHGQFFLVNVPKLPPLRFVLLTNGNLLLVMKCLIQAMKQGR